MSLYNSIAADIARQATEGGASGSLTQSLSQVPRTSAPGGRSSVSRSAFSNAKLPCFGGISADNARELVNRLQRENYAKKNLWLLEITSALAGGAIDMPERFNLFATDLEYSACILQGEPVQVGGAQVSTVTGSDPVELRITTYDDSAGSLKKWFAAHHALASAQDGTISEPAKYAIRIAVVHAYIDRSNAGNAFAVDGLFRPGSLDLSLSRREDALEEISMTFNQLDTFMGANANAAQK